MNTKYSDIPWFALFLIVIGTILFLNKLDVLEIEFASIFWPLAMLFGISKVVIGFSKDKRGLIFLGTVVFLYGLFFFIRSLDFIEIHSHLFLPATLLICGVAFLMIYLQNLRDWPLLIPAVILGGLGSAFILTELGYLTRWEIQEMIHLYWPIALILVGLGIIFRRKASSNPSMPINK